MPTYPWLYHSELILFAVYFIFIKLLGEVTCDMTGKKF